MFTTATPEHVGINSSHIRAFLETLEDHHLAIHSITMARGNEIFFEHYVPPFHKDFIHRIYSSTKSFVSIAIGFCIQDGLVSLDDTMEKLFPTETAELTDENVKKQTVRNMLMMSTARAVPNWFTQKPADRVAAYFANYDIPSHTPGTTWKYDSAGSFVLCALVERLTGMRFLEYLRMKVLDRIGFSKEAKILTCPGGHSWGDSAIICKARDLLATARFVLNYGSWDGEQLLNEAYLREATSNLASNGDPSTGMYDQQGYGYKFWKMFGDGFAFVGMGCEIAVCVPEKDLILIVNADTQSPTSNDEMHHTVRSFYDMIVANTGAPLPESDAHRELLTYASTLRLSEAIGDPYSRLEPKINGVWYTLEENRMGITKFKLDFTPGGGTFFYTNAQGDKQLSFGRRGYGNLYGMFPQTGYSKKVGSVSEPGHKYKCAASHAWETPDTLSLRVQIIDEYFGNFTAKFTFDGDSVKLSMVKTAEDFLNEYFGEAVGKKA